MNSKGTIEGAMRSYFFLKLTLDILKLQMKSKKNLLGVFNGSLQTYTRYSRIADEEQKKGLRRF